MSTYNDVDVCLVMPPVSVSAGPSLALGLLKAALLREGIQCVVDYADIRFNSALGGIERLGQIDSRGMKDFLGEYVFNGPAGIESEYGDRELENLFRKYYDAAEIVERMSVIRAAKKLASTETERTVQRILSRHPKIVGVSSCYQQRNAAIAILKRVKELAPDVVTMMGGANCFGRAGLALLRKFPFIDYVFFGESDDIFADVCRMAMCSSTFPLPYGVLRNGEPLPEEPPHRIVENLDDLPCPEYDDFFEIVSTTEGRCVPALLATVRSRKGEPLLFMEGSRGCWWGEKHPCTFCGLHGKVRTYRKKSPERVFREIMDLSDRYGVDQLYFTDCIMPTEWFDTLLLWLKAAPKKLHLFTELRSNLAPEQLRALAEAGFTYVQPGIESLSNHTLQLMRKGVSVMNNLTFLKYSRKYGVLPSWNILFGFPGETEEDYRQQLAILPLIEHFPPPNACARMLYARDNEYTAHPERYGLQLRPSEYYKFQCPKDENYISDVALYYDDADLTLVVTEKERLKQELKKLGSMWFLRYYKKEGNPRLEQCEMEDHSLLVIDTRSCAAVRAQLLIGAERAVALACERPVTGAYLLQKLSGAYSPEALEEAAGSLMRKKLLLRYEGCFFAVVVPLEREELIRREIEEFRCRLRTDQKLKRGFRETLQRESVNTGNSDETVKKVVTQYARGLKMYFTGEDYVRYLEETAIGSEQNRE